MFLDSNAAHEILLNFEYLKVDFEYQKFEP